MKWQIIQKGQIVDEQLAFPSGTATAQVISVLHNMPLTNTGQAPGRGYRPLAIQDEEPSPPLDLVDDSEDHETEISEVVKNNAWFILAWSFLASGVLAVITPTRSLTNIELETFI